MVSHLLVFIQKKSYNCGLTNQKNKIKRPIINGTVEYKPMVIKITAHQ